MNAVQNKRLAAELAEARARLADRLAAVRAELQSDPTKECLRLHEQFNSWLRTTKGPDRYSDKALAYVNKLNRLMADAAAATKKYDPAALIDEQIELESALQEFDWLMPAIKPAK